MTNFYKNQKINEHAFIKSIQTLGIEFSNIQQESAIKASEAWRQYRKNGGKRTRVVVAALLLPIF